MQEGSDNNVHDAGENHLVSHVHTVRIERERMSLDVGLRCSGTLVNL